MKVQTPACPALRAAAKHRARSEGRSLSGHVRWLIHKDLEDSNETPHLPRAALNANFYQYTAIVERRYRELGGTMLVLHKQGVGHHPHGLDDPALVVKFILEHAARWAER